MFKIPLLSLILQGIPECIGLIALFYALLKLELMWNKIIPLGVLMGIAAYLIRSLPITPGIHSFILIIIYIVVLRILTRQALTSIFFAVFTGFVILAVAELLFSQLIFLVFDKSSEEVVKHPVIWTLTGLPQVISLFVIALVKNKYNQKTAPIKESR